MKKTTMIRVIKALVNFKTVLPILENVLVGKGFIEATDLEVAISIPYPTSENVDTLIPANNFLTALDIFDTMDISTQESGTLEAKNYSCKVNMSNGKKVIKVATDHHIDNYPMTLQKELQLHHVGSLSEDNLGHIETALKFTSDDDLRPAMTGIYFDSEIVATDAHRLYWQPIEPMLNAFILPKKAAKILLLIGGTWEVYHNGRTVMFINPENVSVIARIIDARFPDFKAVIPEGNGNAIVSTDVAELMKEISTAMKFANRSTNLVGFRIDKKVQLHSEDVDFDTEYDSELEKAKIVKKQPVTISFNGKLLNEVLSMLDKKEVVKIKVWDHNKAAIINDNFLIMPYVEW